MSTNEMPVWLKLFFNAANRILPVIGKNPATPFSDSAAGWRKVTPGSFVLIFLTISAHGGAGASRSPAPTTGDPLFHLGMHDMTVPPTCREIGFIAPVGASGYFWVVETPSLIRSLWP